jgi:hypothetical protein
MKNNNYFFLVYIVFTFIFMNNCSIETPSSPRWKIGYNTFNDCLLASKYDKFFGINPLVYVLRGDQVQDVIEFSENNGKIQRSKHTIEPNQHYILLEVYTNFRKEHGSEEYLLNHFGEPLKLVANYNIDYYINNFTGEPFDLRHWEGYPTRNFYFYYGDSDEDFNFPPKTSGKLYGSIYSIPNLKSFKELRLQVDKSGVIREYFADPKHIHFEENLYCSRI